jgi:hypothetical protein
MGIVADVGGVQIRGTIIKNGDHPNVYEAIPLAAGCAGSSWVKDTGTTAHCNVLAEHGWTSCTVDVYWSTGMRFNVSATINDHAFVLAGGLGDQYPLTGNTTIVISKVKTINTAIDGDNVQLLCINSSVRASVYFEDAGAVAVKQIELTANNPIYTYAERDGEASPLTGDPITVCYASNGTLLDGTLTILSLEDSTP